MLRNSGAMRFINAMVLLLITIVPVVHSADDVKTGTIKGKVNYCEKGGYLGMQVFIPGRQFMVLLGQDGNFIFENVPVGSYDIAYVINGRMVNENKNVSVFPGGTNDLGKIVFCADAAAPEGTSATESGAMIPLVENACESNPNLIECVDADKDGVVASKDCNDNDAAIKPGAIELCDGIDNNCNGQIDELVTVNITNGIGSCNAGKISVKSCHKGFDDCDKDPSNGCEINIYNDAENCGSCGYECAPMEMCGLGIC